MSSRGSFEKRLKEQGLFASGSLETLCTHTLEIHLIGRFKTLGENAS